MNKVAVLSGVSATLGVLLIDATIKNYRLNKRNQKLMAANRYEFLRFRLTVEEANFAYQNLDQWKREEFMDMFRANEKYLEAISGAINPEVHIR